MNKNKEDADISFGNYQVFSVTRIRPDQTRTQISDREQFPFLELSVQLSIEQLIFAVIFVKIFNMEARQTLFAVLMLIYCTELGKCGVHNQCM